MKMGGLKFGFTGEMFLILFIILVQWSTALAQGAEGYFNGSSYVSLFSTLDIYGRTSFSFRTCSHGQLLRQDGQGTDFLEISLLPTAELQLRWQVNSHEYSINLGSNLINNKWHDVDLMHVLGTATLSVDHLSTTVANSTYQKDFFELQLGNAHPIVIVGHGFTGCILQGAGVVLNVTSINSHDVGWMKCPLPDRGNCEGYRGDHCFSEPCQHAGKCVSSADSYQCTCTRRYSGRNCEMDLGPLCEKPEFNQCHNGGMCQEDSTGNSTRCICQPRFTGPSCDTMIDNTFCDTHPCRNGGTCSMNQFRDNYACTCPHGFAGFDCELNIDRCQSSPCQNNGSCTDEIHSYTCDCSGTGYKGVNCEININECEENNPCYTGSMCFDRYGGYICDCPPGFGGKNCDQEVNECDSDPCLNGGTCLDNLNAYLCHCIAGFAGINCETNINDCFNAPCPNNTHCIDGINAFSCVCNEGYTGAVPHCVEIDECASGPCLNGGSCIDQLNDYLCTCPHGFKGRFCEINVNECISNPCQNEATCVDGIGKYICSCIPGYTGANCETEIDECDPSPCVNSFTCRDHINDYSCDCFRGWEGKKCDIEINECEAQPCVHGRCIDLVDNYTCACEPGYTGIFCEDNINECDSSPCLNGGTCTDLVADFECQCAVEFMGKNCSQIYDACSFMPCENGGTCFTSVPSRDYTCSCRPGFEGFRCEVDINECENVACSEGQVCFDLENRHECGCPIGFTGPTCSININECSSNPCVNGTCIDGIGNYVCHCPAGLTGKHCEEDIDECVPSPCTNGLCQNLHGSFLCYCRPGFTGVLCDIEFNECLSAPCQNNATCNNLINNYSCTCVPGFQGRNCEENINECNSNPCQNNGTCTDGINKYECACIAGFSGKSCEINIDECAPSPCYNNGICIDLINGFECNCTESGFSGLYCEQNIDDCASNPCTNNATCIDGIKDYHCECHNGYEGKNCEIDIPECSSSPCFNSGLCLENSNKTLYEMNYLGFFPSFSYDSAGGYLCVCSSGFTGRDCETNIDDCEVNACSVHGECVDGINNYTCTCMSGYEGKYCTEEIDECERYHPCQNGATCEDGIASYTCHCSEGFGDQNCGTLLIGCHNNLCENDAICKPFLTPNKQHEYTCICPRGYHGRHCEAITTVSFKGNSSWVLPQQGPLERYVIDLYFRTTLSDGVIAQGNMLHSPFYYTLYLQRGQVNLILTNDSNPIAELSSPGGQNDSTWKNVKVAFENAAVVFNVSGFIEKRELPVMLPAMNFDTTVGSYAQSSDFKLAIPNFIGCIQDVVINDAAIIPDRQFYIMEEIDLGCPREDQCAHSPCVNGLCKDNWTNFECLCSQPYFGKHCEYSHRPATFGYKDLRSYAELTIPADKQALLSGTLEVTFLFRTRKQEGLLFYLGASAADHLLFSDADVPSSSFLAAQLSGGKLQVSYKSDTSNPIEVTLDKRLDDGDYHFVQITKDNSHLIVRANSSTAFKAVLSGPLYFHVLYIGGFPSLQRFRRQLTSPSTRNGLATYSFDNITNFKGILQDFRINNMVVVFYALSDTEASFSEDVPMELGVAILHNTMEGVLSDDLCQPVNPCHQQAECNDIWNEYFCACPKGFRGKNCEEEEPCKNNNCPQNSVCKNLQIGYECVAPASFNGKNNTIHYKVENLSPSISNITFSFRSRETGTILWLQSADSFEQVRFLQVELLNGSTSLEVKWDFSNPPTAIKTVSKELQNIGEWHDVEIQFRDDLKILELRVTPRLTSSLVEPRLPQLSEDNHLRPLGELLSNGSNIYLGGTPEKSNLFRGCLDEVRIGGILLPFFASAVHGSADNPFVMETNNIDIGCILCASEDCVYGQCLDPASSYDCDCIGGYEGQFCSIDMCDSKNPCENHGYCFHLDEQIMCNCTSFFTGPNCTVKDKCASSPCLNGGHCKHNLEEDDFECTCNDVYEGKYCEKKRIVDCSSNPCVHGNCQAIDGNSLTKYVCQCFKGYHGANCEHVKDLCEGKPCGSNGNCSIVEMLNYAEYKCNCKFGFTGANCEVNIDECEANPCKHGECHDGIGSFICSCFPGYEGILCDEKISSCSNSRVCFNGSCRDTEFGYECDCDPGFIGKHCHVTDECDSSKCSYQGQCNPSHDTTERFFSFNCSCKDGFVGDLCAEKLVERDDDDDTSLVLMIIIPVMTLFILCLLVGAVVFLRIAKKKRATRGTYSPSRQEMFGSRVEMNHVMKPPPEERLI